MALYRNQFLHRLPPCEPYAVISSIILNVSCIFGQNHHPTHGIKIDQPFFSAKGR